LEQAGEKFMAAQVNHDTIVFERLYDASPARVFEAFANPEARLRWGTPSGSSGLVYDEVDFRVGGLDISRCGPKGNLICRNETLYRDIVLEHRIVSTETVSEGCNRLSVSLITVEFEASRNGTRLTFIDQIAALGGSGMIDGSRKGYGAAFENLRAEFARAPKGA
jgi:uncharacterized protein YndB with AHSA1/START domain